MKPNLNFLIWWRMDAVGAAACIGLTLAVVLGGFFPLARSHAEDVMLREELEGQRDKAAKMDAALAAVRLKLSAAQKTVETCPLHLESASSINRRLTDVSALAAASGLVIDDIRPERAVPGTYSETIPISVAGSGSYRTCTLFLNRLRRQMPDTGIASVELAAVALDATGSGKFRVDLEWHAAPKP
jgi:Tfp pilus assembly protein PilO